MAIFERIQNVPFVDLKVQHQAHALEIEEAIANVIQRSAYILGSEVKDFEQKFADYCQVKFAVGVDSGTSALEMALRAYHVGPGDEVITTANTFIATALAISFTGATPVFVDIDPLTYTIDVLEVAKAINPKTRAIIPVHLYGQSADMDPILEIAKMHNLIVIEDACQAHGARYKGRRVGSLGNAAAFSFYPAKNLGAYGDAGMVVTNDEQVAEFVRMFRDVGQRNKYHHEIKGYNHRLDNLQAAILGVKLQYLDEWNSARRQNALMYDQLLEDIGVFTPVVADYSEPVWHLYVIRAEQRDALRAHLWDEFSIGTGIHYPIPIHLQSAYKELGYKQGDFPITEEYANSIVSLPMFAELTQGMQEYIVNAIQQFYKG